MPSTNGHGLKRAILYARVSTDEQVRSGYSLAQQIEALRAYAAQEGYEILEEVTDPGQSGASLERPGMDRVRDLVAAGRVSVVLAQDRDRFAREPAYHYLLRREFEEHETKIRALNDRGDDSPEGQLTDGILDQLAKFERAKTTERTRRGKLQKAHEGKVIALRMARFGFRYDPTREGLEVDEDAMRVVRRIFRSIGVEGRTIHGVRRTLEREGVLTPTGKKRWSDAFIRKCITDDIYRPHSFEEIAALVAPEVATKLDPEKQYGVWWFGRRRHRYTQVAESGTNGKVYRKQKRSEWKPEEEWIAVPVPNSGVPRDWVDSAREAIKDNRWSSNAGRRFWELSGGITRCGACAYPLVTHTAVGKSGLTYFYYVCRTRYRKGPDACTETKHMSAAELEARVWEAIFAILKDPDQLRADLDAMIELERADVRGNPDKEAKLWADKLVECDRKRAKYQEMFAVDVMSLDELRARLAELDQVRQTAERELEALSNHAEYIDELEQNRDALLDQLQGVASEALKSLTPEERHRVYMMLRLGVRVTPDGTLEISGAFGNELGFCESKTLSRSSLR
jgi:site-specific DNA recombinase